MQGGVREREDLAEPLVAPCLVHLHLQSALGLAALSAALVAVPFAAAAVLGSGAAPALSRRLGPTALTAAALVLAGTALALVPLIGTGPGGRAALPVLAAGGAAFGVFTAAVFALVLAGVRGVAAGSVSGLLCPRPSNSAARSG
ncbi:hypothetical protein [Streptomyces sp. MK7]|uniref:hypothetical protein n=1 Tax=Streptomyces sp. MK7 TaxID=3067635 RepID=UPI00292F47F9|nr:hypothetical protein [Streptomyces sp. MK7]